MRAEPVAPLRVIPIADASYGTDALRAFARIFVHPNGHSLGNSLVGSRAVPSGSFASRKAGVSMPWNRHREKVLVQALECHPEVVNYRTYPHQLQLAHKGTKISYIPTAAYDRADGSVHVVTFEMPAKRICDAVSKVYAKMGWQFRQLNQSDYTRDSHLNKFHSRLLTCRNVAFTSAESFAVQDLLTEGQGRAKVDTLAFKLGGYPRGFAKICAMHLARHLVIEFDLSRREAVWVSKAQARTNKMTLSFKLWEQFS